MDPAWDMPTLNWQPQGSFEVAVTPTLEGPEGGVQVCIPPFNAEYLPLVLGCLDQLRIPKTWNTTDPDILALVLARVDTLREVFSMAGPCCDTSMRLNDSCVLQYSKDGGSTWLDVTDWETNFPGCVRANIPPVVPVNPPDNPPGQEACNIAWYLAEAILQKALQQRATDRTANNSVSNSVANIINAVFNNNPFIDFLTQAANYLVQTTNPQTAADVAAASTDAGLLAAIAEAIFSAINVQGYVTAANFSQVATNIAAIPYPAHSWVPTMMANFWNNLGLAVIKQMQSEGSVTDGDCSTFGTTWCHYFDFSLNNGGWELWPALPIGHYTGGLGWEYDSIGSSLGECIIAINSAAPMNVTAVQINIAQMHSTALASTHGVSLYSAIGGTDLADAFGLVMPTTYPGFTWVSVPISGTCGCVAIDLVSGFTSNNHQVIGGVQIRGTGVDPFPGFGGCVVGP